MRKTSRNLPKRYFLSDEKRTPDLTALIRRLPTDTTVILRHYSVPDRTILAREVQQLCSKYGHKLIIAGNARLARRIGADGVHWPSFRRDGLLKSHLSAGMIHLASAHNLKELGRALREGADAIFLGPVFATDSHPGTRPLGPHRLARMATLCPVPVIALGGITKKTLRRLPKTIRKAGFGGIGIFIDRN